MAMRHRVCEKHHGELAVSLKTTSAYINKQGAAEGHLSESGPGLGGVRARLFQVVRCCAQASKLLLQLLLSATNQADP